MLSKANAKLIQLLKDKKHRQELGLFVIEGTKTVAELLASKIMVKSLFATHEWIIANQVNINSTIAITEVNHQQLKQISFLTTPQEVLALAYLPKYESQPTTVNKGKVIALDTIQDPGNLGTIIRIADWYGISEIICSEQCADVYNPKVIQATMGSFLRVNIQYTDLSLWLSNCTKPILGALMSGENIHQSSLPKDAVLLIGNEGTGINQKLLSLITHPITIPKFGHAESLNAGIATAIICDNWLR